MKAKTIAKDARRLIAVLLLLAPAAWAFHGAVNILDAMLSLFFVYLALAVVILPVAMLIDIAKLAVLLFGDDDEGEDETA